MAWVFFSSIGCCDWWCACSLCTVWVLSPLTFLQYFPDMPFLVWYHLVSFFLFRSVPVLLYVIWVFLISFAYDITWFDVCIFVFVFDITWCMYYRDYGLYIGGGSYSSVYVSPPLYVFPVTLIVCIPTFFLPYHYVLCACFLVHICPLFYFFPVV